MEHSVQLSIENENVSLKRWMTKCCTVECILVRIQSFEALIGYNIPFEGILQTLEIFFSLH